MAILNKENINSIKQTYKVTNKFNGLSLFANVGIAETYLKEIGNLAEY